MKTPAGSLFGYLFKEPSKGRWVALLSISLIFFQWWVIPRMNHEVMDQWFWALAPVRGFPPWFQFVIPLLLVFLPWLRWMRKIHAHKADPGLPVLMFFLLPILSVGLFWLLRITNFALGDARLILDHFIPLSTYASVREPLESILHTEFSRILFYQWGVHPQTSFQILSCLWGGLALGLCFHGLAAWKLQPSGVLPYVLFIFLIGPVHLFFGYVEWYTQLATGLLVFEVYALRQWVTGKGLWTALGGLCFACCSHLVGLAFVPASFILIWYQRRSTQRFQTLLGWLLILPICLLLTFAWIKNHIEFNASVDATARLFTTLLPLMTPDNPANPPGSWQYAWLSANHLADLANLFLLCGLFPLLLLFACFRLREKTFKPESGLEYELPPHPGLGLFFLVQAIVCVLFVFLWNPWLGFPQDWDLFSFFAWPLLVFALVVARKWVSPLLRGDAFYLAGVPAFSVVWAWILFYHGGRLPNLDDLLARMQGTLAERRYEQASNAIDQRHWADAVRLAESAMLEDDYLTQRCMDLFSSATIQRMADEWPESSHLTNLAADFEIISASPARRLLVLDSWGRLFLAEGGYYNPWTTSPLPGAPRLKAVDMEIQSWTGTAIILREDGELFEVPLSSWVDPNPAFPLQTHFREVPVDARTPHPLGNLYRAYHRNPLGPGQKAVALAIDDYHRQLVVLDTTGNLISSATGVSFEVTQRVALSRCDVEMNWDGSFAFVTDAFGNLTAWPGKNSPVMVWFGADGFGWPTITDLELTRGGNDVYLLDGQGAVHPFSRLGETFIQPGRMVHFAPNGEKLTSTPYVTEPIRFFIDLEIVPNEKAWYRMNRNFRIHYSEQFPD